MKSADNRVVRCAIYTRVSTDSGLDQEFNSLDAQYDASQAYIRSQAHAGWTLVKARKLSRCGVQRASPTRSTKAIQIGVASRISGQPVRHSLAS